VIDIVIPTMKDINEIESLVNEAWRTAGCKVQVMATCQKVSAACNRNRSLDISSSDPLIMIDDDLENFQEGWAAALVQVLEEHPKCVMVSPQLADPSGGPGYMMGGCQVKRTGVTAARLKELPTACIAIRRNDIRFDEHFIGSGFEDNDYCRQLCQLYPDAEFLVCHDVWIVHRNEKKKQHGEYWDHNKAYFEKKWGEKR